MYRAPHGSFESPQGYQLAEQQQQQPRLESIQEHRQRPNISNEQGTEFVNEPMHIPDGENTNTENKRSVPITPHNDIAEISHIERKVYAATRSGSPYYLTHWAPSFNVTPAALEARTTKDRPYGELPFVCKRQTVSDFNPLNFDVEWEPTHEPKSTFLDSNGNMLDVFLDFSSRNGRSQHSSAEAAYAHLSTVYTNDPPTASAEYATAFYSCPLLPSCFGARHFTQNAPMPNTAPASSPELAEAFLGNNECCYAFLTTVLPHGECPNTYNSSLKCVDAKHWRFAREMEVHQLTDADTWDLVPWTDAPNIISGKWVFKIKRDEHGKIQRYKARWVARGFSQMHGIDYTETFSPTVRHASVRLLLSIVNQFNLEICTCKNG
jgi:hypothetical protein